MRLASLLFAAVLVFGIGVWFGHSYGAQEKYDRAYAAGEEHERVNQASVVKHHYEFKQNGASIFRFDLDAGESCWLQLSKADAYEEDHLTTPMLQCSQ
jgi:hypothetical protein